MPRLASVGLVLFLSLGVWVSACGGDDGGDDPTALPTSRETAGSETPSDTPAATGAASSEDAEAIHAVVRRQADANNRKDIDAFVASFSDSYYDALGISRDDAKALVSVFIGVPQVEVTEVRSIEIESGNAIAEVDSNEGAFVSRERYTFVRQGARWLIESIEELPVDAGDSRTIDLTLSEYKFEFDPEAARDPDFAFTTTNAGATPHEVELLKLPAGVNAAGVRDRENLPSGVEVIGLFGPLDAGSGGMIVFAKDLAPGHYALVCYLSAPSGQSNAQLGMVADLTIE
jgi:hypothetical protein